ncbi:MAG TPA: hypothetical protein VNU01_12540, partial [Egibacteraceae bacterium]|nr:hypothetical protein [Egibacteraceae bacterium]
LLGGGDDVLGAALAARLPLARAADDAWSLPAPLGDLIQPAPLEPSEAVAVAEWCLARDLAAEAFAVLWAGGHDEAALGLLERCGGAEAEALLAGWTGPLELPSWRLRDTPVAAERLASAAERAGHPQREPRRRLAAVPDVHGPLAGQRERAQLARDLLQRGHGAEARREAATLLRETTAPDVRARALEIIARVARRAGSAEELSLASTLLREALALWRREDEPGRVAETRLHLAWVDRDRGHSALALERVATVRRGAPPGGALWVQATLAEAALLCDTGRCQAAGALVDELERVAWAWAGPRVKSRAAVVRAWAAVHAEHDEDAARRTEEITADLLGWMDGVCGLRNLAAAAEIWARLGRHDRVAWCLRLIDTVQVAPDWEVTLARAGAECRIGDPVAAMAMLRPLEPPGAAPGRDRWRVLLLGAFAALRAGAQDAPARAVAALQAAVAAGDPYAPFVRERDLARRVLAAAGPVAGGAG